MKVALFAFNGDPMCFVHVLLNAFDLQDKGHEVAVVMEGAATKLVKDLHEDESQALAPMWKKAKEAGVIALVCKACANKMGALESAQAQGLALGADMAGHPSFSQYLENDWKVITF